MVCPYPVVRLGLVRVLEEEAEAYLGRKPRADGTRPPSSVVLCSEGEDLAGKVGHLGALAPGVPVLVMGLESDLALAREALRTGARGFLHVGMQPSHIVRAISLAQRGETVVPRELVTELIREEEPPDLLALTTRQKEILPLVAVGMTNAQIAGRLFLSEFTVKQHLRAAYKLLNVKNRTEAARLLR